VTLLVVVTGPPASGKTMIAERLADDFSLPLVAKDGMKETLFDTLGAADVEESKRLGVAAFALVWHMLEQELRAGRSVIAEGNFNAARALEIDSLRKRYVFDLLQIVCRAPKNDLLLRYTSRTRHAGHFDDARADEIAAVLDPDLYVLPLDIPTVEVDTTSPTAYAIARAAVLERERAP
jgi:predicted kinase